MKPMATPYSPKQAFQSASRRFHVLDTSAVTFTKSRATHAAASLAYYTFFSIFPLMLVLILGGSYFLDRQSMLQRVTQAVQSVVPISQQFIVQNLQQVLKQRAAVGIFVLVSLLWSASNMFNNLAYEINRAWPGAKQRNFWQGRLIGIDMIAGLTGLLLLSIVLDSLTNLLAGINLMNTPLGIFNPWSIISALGSWIAVFFLFFAMYHWIPTVPVAISASIWGALAAAVGWKAATTGFAWYLSSPFARYQLVYGSLGAVVAFLFLIYIIAVVTLFGAHLTAAIDHLHQEKMQTRAQQVTPSPIQDTAEAAPNTTDEQREQDETEPRENRRGGAQPDHDPEAKPSDEGNDQQAEPKVYPKPDT